MMYHIQIGTDTYGRVKRVGSTSIITRFDMASGFPLFPLESLYSIRPGATTTKGIPMFARSESTEIEGIPLARFDYLSILMAYTRGVLGLVVLIGFLGSFMMFITWLTGGQINERRSAISAIAYSVLGLGTGLGLLTYLVPLPMTSRDKEIRQSCETILGIAVDPAQVRADCAESIKQFLNGCPIIAGPTQRFQELALTRSKIALGEPRLVLEDLTDDLLERIRTQLS